MIADTEGAVLRLALDAHTRAAAQDHDPFVACLVVPLASQRRVVHRYDSLEPSRALRTAVWPGRQSMRRPGNTRGISSKRLRKLVIGRHWRAPDVWDTAIARPTLPDWPRR